MLGVKLLFGCFAAVIVCFIILNSLAIAECEANGAVGLNVTGQGHCVYDFGFGWITARYDGGLLDGQLHGKGRYEADKIVYSGDYVANKRQGTGKVTLDDGIALEGRWEDNELDGRASMVVPAASGRGSRFAYDGLWTRGVISGRGALRMEKERYEGIFRYGFPDGSGELTTNDDIAYSTSSRLDREAGRFQMNLTAIISFTVNCTLAFSEVGQPPNCQVFVGTERCEAHMEQCELIKDSTQRLLAFAEKAVDSVRKMRRSLNFVWKTTPNTLSSRGSRVGAEDHEGDGSEGMVRGADGRWRRARDGEL